jgi:diguanylate cyclase
MVAPKRVSEGDELNYALDAFGRILSALGRDAFSVRDRPVEQVRAEFEGWASHLLRLSPPPGMPTPPDRRAWADLTRFISSHRVLERELVEKSITTFREAVEGVLQVFERAMANGRAQDAALRRHVERLHQIASQGAVEDLRRAAIETAESMAVVLAERDAQQRQSAQQLASQVERLGGELEQARHESELDALTRLSNRRALDAALERAVKLRELGRTSGLLLADIDHFKSVNDTYGHPVGDDVLRRLANCLARTFHRKSDVLARYGGEELCVLLPDTALRELPSQADRFLRAVRQLQFQAPPEGITISIGYAGLGTDETAAEWVERTDRALYRAKREGRDRAVAAEVFGSRR